MSETGFFRRTFGAASNGKPETKGEPCRFLRFPGKVFYRYLQHWRYQIKLLFSGNPIRLSRTFSLSLA
jgi:hypothetical protein